MNRLLLVRHAATPATRKAAFPADELLDVAGMEQARGLGSAIPSRVDQVLCAGSMRARQTAGALGLDLEVRADLDECDFGSWTGRTMQEVAEEDPEGFATWCKDPASRPHGGETLEELFERINGFISEAAEMSGVTIAITSGGPIKAAVASVLEAPMMSFWRIDAAPASITELHAVDGTWRCAKLNWSAA